MDSVGGAGNIEELADAGENEKKGLRGLEWVILEVENPTKLGIARGFCILAKAGIRHE
ncbi:MAG: hypothetical protein WA970_14470 [Gammaproteobacteria bacterium]